MLFKGIQIALHQGFHPKFVLKQFSVLSGFDYGKISTVILNELRNRERSEKCMYIYVYMHTYIYVCMYVSVCMYICLLFSFTETNLREIPRNR